MRGDYCTGKVDALARSKAEPLIGWIGFEEEPIQLQVSRPDESMEHFFASVEVVLVGGAREGGQGARPNGTRGVSPVGGGSSPCSFASWDAEEDPVLSPRVEILDPVKGETAVFLSNLLAFGR
jgi:hypothetical protein